MKTKIVIVLFIVSGCLATIRAQQKDMPYRSLESFKNDTTAFVFYNFIDRADQYKGKKLRDVISDLQIPLIDIFPSRTRYGAIVAITLYMSDENLDFKNIRITWQDEIPNSEEAAKIAWSRNIPLLTNFYDKSIIAKTSVYIPESSPYYEKYKPKEDPEAEAKAEKLRESQITRDKDGNITYKKIRLF